MSRIGKKPVSIPKGVTITVKDSVVTVKGPKGELSQQIDRDITVEITETELTVVRPTEQIRHRAMHGLYRSLISNLVKGVTEGYKKDLELVGVGFKAVNAGNILDLALGYSHNIIFEVPKGQNPKIFLEGSDKQLIGQVAAKIRGLRKPEPYKGKGVRYSDEVVRRKAGKAAGK
jgi:large subunit ribosomal protein L6